MRNQLAKNIMNSEKLYSRELLKILNYKDEDSLTIEEIKDNITRAIKLLKKYEMTYEYECRTRENNLFCNKNKDFEYMEKALSYRQFSQAKFVNECLITTSIPLEQKLKIAYHEINDCIDDYGRGLAKETIVNVNEYILYKSLLNSIFLILNNVR